MYYSLIKANIIANQFNFKDNIVTGARKRKQATQFSEYISSLHFISISYSHFVYTFCIDIMDIPKASKRMPIAEISEEETSDNDQAAPIISHPPEEQAEQHPSKKLKSQRAKPTSTQHEVQQIQHPNTSPVSTIAHQPTLATTSITPTTLAPFTTTIAAIPPPQPIQLPSIPTLPHLLPPSYYPTNVSSVELFQQLRNMQQLNFQQQQQTQQYQFQQQQQYLTHLEIDHIMRLVEQQNALMHYSRQ